MRNYIRLTYTYILVFLSFHIDISYIHSLKKEDRASSAI